MQLTRTEQAEWDRMNAENAKAAEGRTTTTPVVTKGNTGR
jgi:hypothetical protein